MIPHAARLILLALGISLSLLAQAQSTVHTVLIDSDNTTASGCLVSSLAGTVEGVEVRLQATVSGEPPQVASVTSSLCEAGAFGPESTIGGGYPVALDAGTAGADAVELAAALAEIPGDERSWTGYFMATSAEGADLMGPFQINLPQIGIPLPPNELQPAVPVPSLAILGSAVLVLLVLATALRLRHRTGLLSLLVVGSILAAAGIALAAAIAADGDLGDWGTSTPAISDPNDDASGAAPLADLVAGFYAVEMDQVFFRMDSVELEERPAITFSQSEPFCSFNDVTCTATSTQAFSVAGACDETGWAVSVEWDQDNNGSLDGDVTADLSGTGPDYVIGGAYPIGNHRFAVTATDACANEISEDIPFSVVDCKAPSPICINGLAVELMPTPPDTDADGDGDFDAGAMGIWAEDFIASPRTECSGPVVYSINKPADEPDIDQDGLILTCDDLGSLTVWIQGWDTVGNRDYCETLVLVQDADAPTCPD